MVVACVPRVCACVQGRVPHRRRVEPRVALVAVRVGEPELTRPHQRAAAARVVLDDTRGEDQVARREGRSQRAADAEGEDELRPRR